MYRHIDNIRSYDAIRLWNKSNIRNPTQKLTCDSLAARAGMPPPPPRIAAPGRFFGAPWWPPPEACSGALNCGLAARAGIPPPPRIAVKGRFFGAPARGLLRGPQFRIAWLSVATGTIVVRRNKYRFRILHIYALKPITWQPSTIQTDGERQWAEWVLCVIGGPRETVYSDCSSLDRRAKMSTSRKPNWPNTGVQPEKNQSPNPPSVPRPRRRPPQRGEQSPPALRSQVLNLFAFATGYRAKNYLQDSVCSLAHFRAYARPVGHTETDDAWNPWATETLLGSRRSR